MRRFPVRHWATRKHLDLRLFAPLTFASSARRLLSVDRRGARAATAGNHHLTKSSTAASISMCVCVCSWSVVLVCRCERASCFRLQRERGGQLGPDGRRLQVTKVQLVRDGSWSSDAGGQRQRRQGGRSWRGLHTLCHQYTGEPFKGVCPAH